VLEVVIFTRFTPYDFAGDETWFILELIKGAIEDSEFTFLMVFLVGEALKLFLNGSKDAS